MMPETERGSVWGRRLWMRYASFFISTRIAKLGFEAAKIMIVLQIGSRAGQMRAGAGLGSLLWHGKHSLPGFLHPAIGPKSVIRLAGAFPMAAMVLSGILSASARSLMADLGWKVGFLRAFPASGILRVQSARYAMRRGLVRGTWRGRFRRKAVLENLVMKIPMDSIFCGFFISSQDVLR